jgi:uncharacterized protein YdiU (UPF0061 family)
VPDAETPLFVLDDTFVRALPELGERWTAAEAPAPHLLAFNESLAAELGLDGAALQSPGGVAALVGNVALDGAVPVAQAYAGHQFGGFSPRLGDGRALLLGELHDAKGRRRDLHLKGSGRTPFARGGDGKAAVGPMLREYVIAEAMHALGIPTTRALAVVGTGEFVTRETMLPGAVLARVAASHLRVGTFEYAVAHGDVALLTRLADYAIARHHPSAVEADNPYVAFFDAVMDAQASLIAQWMNVGFIHGVMNTDNMTISGETIDYGPCAFMDAFDPETVFSSIDHAGRYAYGNQPRIAHWNLVRLAETLVPLFAADAEQAVAIANEALPRFPARYREHWRRGMRAKLGLPGDGRERDDDSDGELADDLLSLMHTHHADFTSVFRALAASLRGDGTAVRALLPDAAAFDAWSARWHDRLGSVDPHATARSMDQVNPRYIPRNHLVEDALSAATGGDLQPFRRLVDVVLDPFEERPGLERYAAPAPSTFGPYRTFCGT